MNKKSYREFRPEFIDATVDLLRLTARESREIKRVFGVYPFMIAQMMRRQFELIKNADKLEKRIAALEKKIVPSSKP